MTKSITERIKCKCGYHVLSGKANYDNMDENPLWDFRSQLTKC